VFLVGTYLGFGRFGALLLGPDARYRSRLPPCLTSYHADMSTQEKPSPETREAVVSTYLSLPLRPPSGVPHVTATGVMEEREVREWPRFWRKRTMWV
jgi:hypothetical protein